MHPVRRTYLVPDFLAGADVFKLGDIIFKIDMSNTRHIKSFSDVFAHCFARAFINERGGGFYPAAGIGKFIVIDDQSAFVVEAI